MNIGLMSRWNVWFCLVVVVAHCAVRSEHNSLRKLEVPAEHLPLWAALNQSLLDECVRDKVCQVSTRAIYDIICINKRNNNKLSINIYEVQNACTFFC